MNRARPGSLLMNGLFKGVENKTGMGRPTDPPAHNAARENINDKGDMNEALPCGDIGKVTDSEHVRCWCFELAVHLIQRTGLGLVRDRSPDFATTNDTLDPNVLHQPCHRASGNIEAFAAHLMPDLADPVDLVVLFPDARHLRPQRHVALSPIRKKVRVLPLGKVVVERGGGDGRCLQITSTPMASRCSSMKAIMSWTGGRALLEQNMPTPF